ncbi:MAG: hypothetical protein ABIH11_02525 [Candidatus Altiarchaeota archaeon]
MNKHRRIIRGGEGGMVSLDEEVKSVEGEIGLREIMLKTTVGDRRETVGDQIPSERGVSIKDEVDSMFVEKPHETAAREWGDLVRATVRKWRHRHRFEKWFEGYTDEEVAAWEKEKYGRKITHQAVQQSVAHALGEFGKLGRDEEHARHIQETIKAVRSDRLRLRKATLR